MPRTEDIERFAEVLTSLGDEPAIRAARAEEAGEPAAEAEEGLDTLPPESQSTAEMPPEQPGGELEGLQELFESLSTTPDETSGKGPAGESGAEEIDLSSLFGEESGPQSIEDIGAPSATPGAPSDEESFSFPEGEPSGLQSDLSQMEVLPEEPAGEAAEPGPEETGLELPGGSAEPGAAEPGAAEPGLSDFSLPDLGEMPESSVDEQAAAPGPEETGAGESFEDFGAFPLEAPEATATEEEEPREQAAAPGAGGIELPNLEDISFTEPSGEIGGEAPSPETEAFPSEPAAEAAGEQAPAEPESLGGFDLDTAGFDTFAPEKEEPKTPSTGAEEPGAGLEGLGEESLGELNLDEFSLPESAEQFGIEPTEAPPPPPKQKPRRERQRPAPSEPPVETLEGPSFGEAGAGEIALTPEQFARLKATLGSLPRNLKVVVEDLIGEGTATGDDLAKLIDLLVKGAAAADIATLAGRISGKRIRIPAGYEKKTGRAFEAETRTFGYAFRENILPVLRVVLLTVLIGALLGFVGYRYVYRPIYAWSNYSAGYGQIANDRFGLANERFSRAERVWPMKPWFYRYAEAFAAKRQFVLAEEKYEDLLARFPDDRKGILDYARMESTGLADYEKADALLQRIINKHLFDYDALLASGDNQLEWAARVPAKYEAARLTYATLMEKYGVRDELLFRMLRYFIRTDQSDEVERLRAYYASRPEVKIDAAAFAELGGYLVDHRRLDYVQDVLFRANKVNPRLYESHYNLARYYRLVRADVDEKTALDATLRLLPRTEPLTPKRLAIEIDTHTRLGEYLYRTKEPIAAEKELQTAVGLVEKNQSMGLVGKDRRFGRAYAALGDLYYYLQGDLGTAFRMYQDAAANSWATPELAYKMGFIQYAQRDYRAAVGTFTRAEDATAYPAADDALDPITDVAAAQTPPGQPPQNLLYAIGNSFYQRGDYFAAQGYFLRLRDRLETRRAQKGFLHPEASTEDRALLSALWKVDNNLGVTMVRLAERTGDRRKRSEALVYLTAATEIADGLARDPSGVQRSASRTLPSVNVQSILYPMRGNIPQISPDLPRDFSVAEW